MKRILFLVFICVIMQRTMFLHAQRLPETIIKIGIILDNDSLNLSCEGRYSLFELHTGRKENIKSMNVYLVRSQQGKIQFNGGIYNSPIRIVPEDENNTVRINGRRYRDSVLIASKKDKLTVINELGLDSYIYGILPREVSPEWPLEALKVQAIVSRTYALRNIGKHKNDNFDLCATVHCQVYGGVESEDARTTRAVELTKGKVLVYNGKLANALFHACCAGHTESPNFVWHYSSDATHVEKYLRGVSCRFCKATPHSQWKKTVDTEQLEKKMRKAGYDVGRIKSIQRSAKTDSGRTHMLILRHDKGITKVNAAKFRLIVDPSLIKSTYLDRIVLRDDIFTFVGRGWGHGVGLCQWGAERMAERGYSHKKILQYYFPGTTIETWDE